MEVVTFVGTMYLPDGDIRPVHKVANVTFIPPTWKCYVNWEEAGGKPMAFCMRFEHGEFTDAQLLEKMTAYLKKEWKVRYGEGAKP